MIVFQDKYDPAYEMTISISEAGNIQIAVSNAEPFELTTEAASLLCIVVSHLAEKNKK